MSSLVDFLPAKRDEAFRYTSFAALARREYATPRPRAVDPDALPAPLGQRVLFIDGVFVSPQDSRPEGRSHVSVLQDSRPEGRSHDEGALQIMNAALATQCVRIDIAADTDAGVVELLFVATDHDDRVAAYPQVHINAGRGAKAVIVERHIALGKAQDFTNVVTEVSVGESASVEQVILQESASQATLATGVFATVAAGGRFVSHAVHLGGALVRADIGVTLAGRGAHCGLYGLHLPGLKQHVDTHSSIIHAVPDTTSDEHYRAVVDRGGRSVFNGMVVVKPGADRSDAQQYNANLLLSEQAEADTKPELEIYADDVKAAHGATVGRLDEEALFYLRSRGVDESTARNVLIWAFADEALMRIPLGALRRLCEDAVLDRLPNASLIQEFR